MGDAGLGVVISGDSKSSVEGMVGASGMMSFSGTNSNAACCRVTGGDIGCEDLSVICESDRGSGEAALAGGRFFLLEDPGIARRVIVGYCRRRPAVNGNVQSQVKP